MAAKNAKPAAAPAAPATLEECDARIAEAQARMAAARDEVLELTAARDALELKRRVEAAFAGLPPGAVSVARQI